MKVAVVHNIPIHYKHLLFKAMKNMGMDFDVLFQASGSPLRNEQLDLSQDAYRHRIGFSGTYELAPALRKISWTWRALRDAQPDIVIISGYHTAESWTAWLWAMAKRAPAVLWIESNEFDYPRNALKELPKRLFLKGISGAHVYGESNKAYLVKLGLQHHQIITRRAVADVAKFLTSPKQKTYRSGGITNLLFVGRLLELKNLSRLLRAFTTAVRNSDSPLRLTIVGTGPMERQLKNEAIQLDIASLVDFKGYVYQKDLSAIYRTADFFILPSTCETWGLVTLEAMLCSVPVLVSTQCGCAADLVNSETGWTFSPWDESQLAALIQSLPSIPNEKLMQMGAAAHQLALRYSPENCARLVAGSVRFLKSRASRISETEALSYYAG